MSDDRHGTTAGHEPAPGVEPDPKLTPAPWLAELAAELALEPGSDVLPFTLLTVVAEAVSWGAYAPAGSWARRNNVTSLAVDLDATAAVAGPSLAGMLEPDLAALAGALDAIAAAKGPKGESTRVAQIKVVTVTATALLEKLAEPRCRHAVLDDLLAVAADAAGSAVAVRHLVELLATLLDHAGLDPRSALLGASLHLAQSRWRPPNKALPGYPAPDATQTQRLDGARTTLTAVAPAEHCIVWLTYGDARLNGDNVIGPITLYDIDWAVPNAQREDGQDFPHKQEVSTLLEYPGDLADIDYDSADRPYIVLARVDLGVRRRLHAIDAAADLVETVMTFVNHHTGGTPWYRESFSALLVEGKVVGGGSGPHGRMPLRQPDHYGQNATARALGRNTDILGALLAAGPLPPALAQALRLVREAGQVGSREDRLNRTATIDAQSALLLAVSAIEHIAVYAGMTEEELTPLLLSDWPICAWRRDVRDAISRCMHNLGGTDPLFGAICLSEFGDWSLTVAYERRAELLQRCRERLHRTDVAVLLDSIGDAGAAAAMLKRYAQQGQLLDARVSRTRNALAHGNPATLPTVFSCADLARFKLDGALDATMRAHTQQRQPGELLLERAAGERETVAALAAGVSLYQQWAEGADASSG